MQQRLLATPAAYHSQEWWSRSGRLKLRWEEEGTVWCWLDSSLVWDAPVEWVFSPGDGNERWPGDLWGVDANGDLVIVEAKLARGPCDPYEDFVGRPDRLYERAEREEFTVKSLRARWQRLLEIEHRWPHAAHYLDDGGTYGVLPYSAKRECLRRWPEIAETLTSKTRSMAYRAHVERYLSRRETVGEPPPHYVGLFVVPGDKTPRLNTSGRNHLQRLLELVGSSRVHARAISARRISDDSVELESASLDPAALAVARDGV